MQEFEKLMSLLNVETKVVYSSTDELQAILSGEKSLFINLISQDLSVFSSDLVEIARLRFAGRKSPLQELLKSLRTLPAEERKNAGALINHLKTVIETDLESFLQKWRDFSETQKLSNENDDLSLPLPSRQMGSRHPVSVVMRDLLVPFQRMGFSIVDGPEIDNDFYNFEALNISKDHPAREMQDTLFLASEWVLRTHTSNVQSHAMLERGVPLKIVCPGCVYRNEFDMTHTPAFRQIECLVVDEGIHMGHLKHVINELLNSAFGRKVNVRFRSSYFPFTEPSAEVDVECQQCFGQGCRSCKFVGWSEIGGCGVVHRKVLESCGVDPSVYSGIAFGFGVDRIAKDRFAIADLRSMLEGNVSFLKSFGLN